jgi:hypothetical protein
MDDGKKDAATNKHDAADNAAADNDAAAKERPSVRLHHRC